MGLGIAKTAAAPAAAARAAEPAQKAPPNLQGRPAFRLGLAVFQNDENPTNGVAALHGQRVRPFESRTSLPTDCLWISTARDGEVAQNFRPKNFLRSSIDALADDLGVELRDVVDGMPKMARVLDQVAQILSACYEWDEPHMAWSKPTLAEVIREAMPRQPGPVNGVIGPFKDALQTYSAIPDRVLVRDHKRPIRQFTLRHNRLEYARYLLSQPVPNPVGEWLAVKFDGVEEALSCDRPCLFEVALEFDSPDSGQIDYSRLVAFGSASTARRSAGTIRRWVSQPELAWLARHARVHIKDALLCNAPPVSIPEEVQLPAALRSDPLLALSLAAGVVAEAHWVSLTLGRLKKREHSGASAKFQEVFSPMAVWLRAHDRAYGFFMAEQAAKAGYEVVGYGYGSITVESDRNEPAKLLELADRLGVCHPNLIALQNRIALGGLEVEVSA